MLFLLFLNYLFIFLIPAVIAQIFNHISELIIPVGIPSKEGNAEIETHPVISETMCAFFVLLTHQFILVYFFNEVILYFFYIF